MKKEYELKILALLDAKKSIHFTELMPLLKIGMETARRFAIEISLKYPNNFRYIRGVLTQTKPLEVKIKDEGENSRLS
jgi:hypothetical protein